jgi:hypothetical protein
MLQQQVSTLLATPCTNERKEVAFDTGTEHGSNEQVRTSRELVPVSASIEDSLGGKERETYETM